MYPFKLGWDTPIETVFPFKISIGGLTLDNSWVPAPLSVNNIFSYGNALTDV